MAKKSEKGIVEEKLVCHKCEKRFHTLPFKCKFCSLYFCDDHRLPEDHSCLGLALRKEGIKERVAKGQPISYEPQVKKEIKVKFEEEEQDEKDVSDALLKSPIAIIGIIVAILVFIGILIVLFK